MKEIKVMMLDMDGVVNSYQHSKKWLLQNFEKERQKDKQSDVDIIRKKVMANYSKQFCVYTELVFEDLAERINRICDQTDCYIVWSSTWRKLQKYSDLQKAREMFNRRGLQGDRLIAYTPCIGMSWQGHCRGSQISAWIRNNEQYKVIKCAVIDDRYDAGFNLPQCAKFFQIDGYVGISEENVKEIVDYLK